MRRLLLSYVLILFCHFVTDAQYLFTLQVNSNKIAYDSKRKLIYASVKGSDINYANSFIAIEPGTGRVTKNIFVGSEPTSFVFTSDSDYVFICFDGTPVVKKFDLNQFTIIKEIYLGTDQYNGSLYGNSLAVLPNNDSVIIVSLKVKGVSPSYSGVAAYANDRLLPDKLSTFMSSGTNVDFILSSANDTIYGYDASTSEDAFYIISAKADYGLTFIKKQSNFLKLKNAKFEKGLIFDDNGNVVNPSIPAQIGSFPINKIYGFEYFANEPDYKKNKVFFSHAKNGSRNLDFYSYNRTTFGIIGWYSIPNAIPSGYSIPAVSQLIRFGSKGLATIIYDDYFFTTQSSNIAILNNSSFVDSIPKVDTTGLSKLFILDTVKVFTNIVVHDTIKVYNHVPVYDTIHLAVKDTLVIYSSVTYVNENIILSKVTLYPNPTSSVLNVDIENDNVIANYKIQIFNTLGQLKYESLLNTNHISIDLSPFSKGVYIVRIADQNQRAVSVKNLVIK